MPESEEDKLGGRKISQNYWRPYKFEATEDIKRRKKKQENIWKKKDKSMYIFPFPWWLEMKRTKQGKDIDSNQATKVLRRISEATEWKKEEERKTRSPLYFSSLSWWQRMTMTNQGNNLDSKQTMKVLIRVSEATGKEKRGTEKKSSSGYSSFSFW